MTAFFVPLYANPQRGQAATKQDFAKVEALFNCPQTLTASAFRRSAENFMPANDTIFPVRD